MAELTTRRRVMGTRIGLSAMAIAASASLGGCIFVHTTRLETESSHWERQENRQRQMIGTNTGRVSESLAAQTGVDSDRATLVTKVFRDSPASAGGLERFDIIVAINGDDSASPRRFRQSVLDTPQGESLRLTVLRQGEARDLDITPRPAHTLFSESRNWY